MISTALRAKREGAPSRTPSPLERGRMIEAKHKVPGLVMPYRPDFLEAQPLASNDPIFVWVGIMVVLAALQEMPKMMKALLRMTVTDPSPTESRKKILAHICIPYVAFVALCVSKSHAQPFLPAAVCFFVNSIPKPLVAF